MEPATALVLISLATPLASAKSRSPVIRVAVGAAQTGMATAVKEALRRQKPDSTLAYAARGEPADLALSDTGWYMYTYRAQPVFPEKRAPGQGLADNSPDESVPMQAVEALVHDARVAGRPMLHRADLVEGKGAIWHDAVANLVDNLAEYAQLRLHELLRRRPDWPDVGFEFEPLTKQRKKQFGAKDGKIVVTTVTPGGLAERAGLRPADAIRGFGDKKLKSPAELARFFYMAAPGTQVSLQVSHGGARRNVALATP